MSIILILLTAIGLSMDAFSLALIYGTLNMRSKMNNIMSITVTNVVILYNTKVIIKVTL